MTSADPKPNPITPKHTLEIYDLTGPEGITVGYRIISANNNPEPETAADFLAHSLAEILGHIGQALPNDTTGAHYPWPL